MGDGPTLYIRHDARLECEGAVAEMREDQQRFRLTHKQDFAEGDIDATLTEREAVSLMAVLQGAVNWFRQQKDEARKDGSAP